MAPVGGRSGIIAVVRRHPVVTYFVLAFAFSWAYWIPLARSGQIVRVGFPPTHFPGLLGPLGAALVTTALTRGRAGLRDLVARMFRWRVGWRWWLIAAFSPFVFFTLGAAITAALGRGWPDLRGLGRFGGVPPIGVVGVWIILVLINGFGEETGWRGYAQAELQRRHNWIVASLIIAVPWALWHAPTFWVLETYRSLGPVVLPGFFLGLAAGAIVHAFIYNRSGGSILMAALWHGSFNMASGSLAARGIVAAVTSTAVMIWAIVLVILEVRSRRGRRFAGQEISRR